MKKGLVLFIMAVVLIVLAKIAYTKYCASKPNGCVEEKMDYEKDGLPIEGMEW